MFEHPYSNVKFNIKPLSLTSSFLLYPDELARIVATPLRLCEKFGLRGFILKFPFAFVLDRIYRIDRIKRAGIEEFLSKHFLYISLFFKPLGGFSDEALEVAPDDTILTYWSPS